jgi:DNA-binding CsgD family transcriptional regulator
MNQQQGSCCHPAFPGSADAGAVGAVVLVRHWVGSEGRGAVKLGGKAMALPSAAQNRAGDHSCGLYTGVRERDTLLLAFLREGLLEGDKCMCIVDRAEPAVVRARVMRDLDIEDPGHRLCLDIERAREVHLRAGRFSADQTASFLTQCVSRALDGDFETLRGVGEMSWLPRTQTADDCLSYELTIQRMVTRAPALFMCLYDLQRCSLEVLVAVLRTHPKVLLKDAVLVNPRYQDVQARWDATKAHEAQGGAAARTGRSSNPPSESDRWYWLTDSELRVSRHVAAGRTNRQIAELLMVSRHTVDAHLKHIYVKLDIHTRVELTVLALRHATHL